MSFAYYNEHDPYAAEWLGNLILAGHIAPGIVDTRSIEDVTPNDLRGFTQCHFFAGIGVWSHALRMAGWPDHRSVWSASCPCQPFSTAGQGAGFDDERHLWPHLHWLAQQCRPAVIVGEQVASKDADSWIDLVSADLEALGYAFGAVAFPAAGVGAPHIRDRTYWVAYADHQRLHGEHALLQRHESGWLTQDRAEVAGGGAAGGVAHADRSAGRQGGAYLRGWVDGSDAESRAGSGGLGVPGGLGDADHSGLEGLGGGHHATRRHGQGAIRPVAEAGELGGVGDTDGQSAGGHSRGAHATQAGHGAQSGDDHRFGDAVPSVAGGVADSDCGRHRPVDARADLGPVEGSDGALQAAPHAADAAHSPWRDADWLLCRDGKWRPVEPGSFPLVAGAPARVGRLRAYGNALCAPAAQAWVEAVMGG